MLKSVQKIAQKIPALKKGINQHAASATAEADLDLSL